MSPSKEYSEVGSSSSEERLLADDEFYYYRPQTSGEFKKHLKWITHTVYLATIAGILIFFLSRASSLSELDCARRQNTWSPAISQILPYKETMFNGTLDYPSEFRGKPSPAVDAAWETLVRMDSIIGFRMNEEEYMKLGHPLDENTVYLTEEQGGGILGGLEVFHQLHCLNLVRQYTYADYYQNRSITFTDKPELVRTHVDHCIEMLRQKLTCDADVGVISHTWVKQRESPWPNFNVRHKCRNFNAVVEWSLKNNAPDVTEDIIRPSNIAGLDPPP